MVRRYCVSLLICVLLFVSCSALAASSAGDTYSDAVGSTTEDTVLDIKARPLGTQKDYMVDFEIMDPTQLTIDTLSAIYEFVDVNVNPPARYFPEYVQKQIDDIVIPMGVDKDDLHMPKFMSKRPKAESVENDVEVTLELDMEFHPGQLVVVVLGWLNEAHELEWKALDAEVPQINTVRYMLPSDVLATINGRETLFLVLTVRPGGSGEAYNEGEKTPEFIPSKSAGDMMGTGGSYSVNTGAEIKCDIVIVEPTEVLRREINDIEWHVAHLKRPVISYYNAEINRLVQMQLSGVELSKLVAYEALCVKALEYKDTYGDITTEFAFATPYHAGQKLVSLLGLPDENNKIEWTMLRTRVEGSWVEITFSATVLPQMMQETALLVVLSTPLAQ